MPPPSKLLPSLKITKDGVADLRDALQVLIETEILVGFPESGAARKDPKEPTNAQIAYVQDNGAPELNIPARPFMIPGINASKDAIEKGMTAAAKVAFKQRNKIQVIKMLHRVGLAAQLGIRRKINEGIPPPLSERTLEARARRGRKGAKQELANRAQGLPASTALAKPLVDTAQMRNAVTYVLRKRSARRK